jgi:hypothetical protein
MGILTAILCHEQTRPLVDHVVGAGDQRERDLRSLAADEEPLRETRLAASGPWAVIRDVPSRISLREGLVRPLQRLICWLALAYCDCQSKK